MHISHKWRRFPRPSASPQHSRAPFTQLFHTLRREKVLRRLCFLGHYYLVSLDGARYCSSKKVHCEHCLERYNSRAGEITYSHQLLGAVSVCPGHAEVAPLYPEPVIKQDDSTKNDCERNVVKQFLQNLREDYPRVPFINITANVALSMLLADGG